jgi:pectate lyase
VTGGQRRRLHRWLVLAAVVVVAAVVVTLVVTLGSGGDDTAGHGSPSPTASGSAPVSGPTGPANASVPQFPAAGPVPANESTVLASRVGFGGGVSGGAGGAVVHVSSDADSGPGSLRAALAGDTARWVVFDRDLTIRLSSGIAVGSNKTIDGRGHDVELTAPGQDGLDLVGVHNVIVESLTLHDFGDVTKTADNDTPDAIHLDHAEGVWIDHDDLSMAGDKLIAVSNGSSGITVSWNHFHDQEQVFQVGNQATAAADAVQTVTVHHNFFDHTGYRNPVIAYGRAHVYDNYYLDWKTYAVRSQRAAQLYLQNNVFAAGDNRRASITTTGGDGCNDQKTHCDDRPGDLKAVGNLLLGNAKIKQNAPTAVVAPSSFYRYTAEAATTALAGRIAAGVGPVS